MWLPPRRLDSGNVERLTVQVARGAVVRGHVTFLDGPAPRAGSYDIRVQAAVDTLHASVAHVDGARRRSAVFRTGRSLPPVEDRGRPPAGGLGTQGRRVPRARHPRRAGPLRNRPGAACARRAVDEQRRRTHRHGGRWAARTGRSCHASSPIVGFTVCPAGDGSRAGHSGRHRLSVRRSPGGGIWHRCGASAGTAAGSGRIQR